MDKSELTKSNMIVVKKWNNRYLFEPDSVFKSNWDLFISVVLIISCLITPYRMAFVDEEKLKEFDRWIYLVYSIDMLFLIDIIIIFNSSYYDEDYETVTDRKLIAKQYLKGWFAIDFFAIFPFNLFFQGNSS